MVGHAWLHMHNNVHDNKIERVKCMQDVGSIYSFVSQTLVQFKRDLFIIIGTNSFYTLAVIGRYSQSQTISSVPRQAL